MKDRASLLLKLSARLLKGSPLLLWFLVRLQPPCIHSTGTDCTGDAPGTPSNTGDKQKTTYSSLSSQDKRL